MVENILFFQIKRFQIKHFQTKLRSFIRDPKMDKQLVYDSDTFSQFKDLLVYFGIALECDSSIVESLVNSHRRLSELKHLEKILCEFNSTSFATGIGQIHSHYAGSSLSHGITLSLEIFGKILSFSPMSNLHCSISFSHNGYSGKGYMDPFIDIVWISYINEKSALAWSLTHRCKTVAVSSCTCKPVVQNCTCKTVETSICDCYLSEMYFYLTKVFKNKENGEVYMTSYLITPTIQSKVPLWSSHLANFLYRVEQHFLELEIQPSEELFTFENIVYIPSNLRQFRF